MHFSDVYYGQSNFFLKCEREGVKVSIPFPPRGFSHCVLTHTLAMTHEFCIPRGISRDSLRPRQDACSQVHSCGSQLWGSAWIKGMCFALPIREAPGNFKMTTSPTKASKQQVSPHLHAATLSLSLPLSPAVFLIIQELQACCRTLRKCREKKEKINKNKGETTHDPITQRQ